MQLNRSVAAVVLLLLTANAIAATTYFTAASIPGANSTIYFQNGVQSGTLSQLYQYVQLTDNCNTACVTASSSSGTPLGNFYFSIANVGNAYLAYPSQGGSLPATGVAYGNYYEHFAGAGVFYLYNAANTYLLSLQSGSSYNFNGFSIYATPGTSSATLELDMSNATSSVISNLPSTFYLDISGPTIAPVSLATGSLPPNTFKTFNNLALDWSITASDTPYSPSSPVPLPSSGWLLLSSLLAFSSLVRHGRGNRSEA